MPEKYPIIVFSHLRWDFVFQRPQHLLSRLASGRKIYFFEEPMQEKGVAPYLDKMNPVPNVTVLRPYLPTGGRPFGVRQLPILKKLLREAVQTEHLEKYVVWLYTAMALPLAEALSPSALVYDCMDELSAFKGAPPELLDREARLLANADVVFTGGPSLYRAKQGRHANLHCFSSSVDTSHFEKAKQVKEAADQASLPHPRLGFYGVIDERFDLDLLEKLAKSHPEWQLIMLGPVVKINQKDLPGHKNIHYLGLRSYEELPAYLAGWDICLLPFALNESTKFISPTKTLEYMAAGLPIVSTPITDVAEPYGHIVYLRPTAEEIIAGCEAALQADDEENRERQRGYEEVLGRTSWDATAEAIDNLIEEAVKTRTEQFPTKIK